MNTETINIKKLKPNPANPRTIRDDKFHKLVQSVKDFPQMLEIRPIVVNDQYEVLGGNMRLRACIEAGMKEVTIIRASELTEDQQREFIIKDNVGFGEWDMDALANEWDAKELQEWGLDLPGDFSGGLGDDSEAQEDGYEMPDEINTDIALGDLFEIGEHRLLCGDSTDRVSVERLMGGRKADMVLTDPPYNVNYEGGSGLKIMNDKMNDSAFFQFLLLFYASFSSITKEGGAWYVWHSDTEGANFRRAFIESGLLLKQCLVWVKNSLVMGRQDYHWKHEPCLYGWKPGAAHYFIDDRTNTTVIEDKVDLKKLKKDELVDMLERVLGDKVNTSVLYHDKPLKNNEHPTMKPILLLAPLIKNSSIPGWIVSDAFLGSGSTMVAAHQLNRRCFGMELDPKYCQVIIDRMLKLDPALEIKKNGQPYEVPELTAE